MGECKLDHSLEDVKKKLQDQSPYLGQELTEKVASFLDKSISQAELNEMFHLLKKYDLAEESERRRRDEKIKQLVGA
ncbi:MAG: group-specific protein [Bacillaceae bacterium]|nr:group-specific protein [Bacillaceae bacterium]